MFLVIITLFLSVLIPHNVEAKIQTMGLIETLKAEDISPLYKDYKETEEQITIYLFRSDGCQHCRDFLTYLNSISEEYGYMFKLQSYECSTNADNEKVKNQVANFFGETASGVPYIIIGESTFYGYRDETSDKILQAIKAEYEAKNKYDVFKEIENKRKRNTIFYISLPLIGTVIIFFIVKGAKDEN